MKTILAILALAIVQNALAGIVDESRLADAIRVEEGNNPRWLYGIHHSGHPLSEAEARRRCLTTVRHAEKDFTGGDFILFLSKRYCPVNYISWSVNVKKIYANEK